MTSLDTFTHELVVSRNPVSMHPHTGNRNERVTCGERAGGRTKS